MGQNFLELCLLEKNSFVQVCFRGELERNSPTYLFPLVSHSLERSVNLLRFFLFSTFISLSGGTPSGSLPGMV